MTSNARQIPMTCVRCGRQYTLATSFAELRRPGWQLCLVCFAAQQTEDSRRAESARASMTRQFVRTRSDPTSSASSQRGMYIGPAPAGPHHTILIVESDARLRHLMQRNLELAGYRVCTAQDGPMGWEAYTTARPDLVITGLMLAGFRGFELIQRIREGDRMTKIVVWTLATASSNSSKALALGADVFLCKPLGGREVLAVVRDLLVERPPTGEQPAEAGR